MNTQQQAYIEGFVKRAAEYGFNQSEAIGILKESGFMEDITQSLQAAGDRMADKLQSSMYNTMVEGLTDTGLPHHQAIYGVNNTNPDDITRGIADMMRNKYESDVFGAEHPMLASIGKYLKSHDIDPTKAALTAGGAGLLGGGYMLGKANKNKNNDIREVEL